MLPWIIDQSYSNPFSLSFPSLFVVVLVSVGVQGSQLVQEVELTEEQKQEIREAFDLFDTDGSELSMRRS